MSYTLLLPQMVTISTIGDGGYDADRNWLRTSSSSNVDGRLELLYSAEPGTPGRSGSSGGAASNGIGVEDRWRLFLPAGTALTAADEVAVDGRRYQVIGTPNRVYGASAEHHVEALLLYVGDVEQAPISLTTGYPATDFFPSTSLYPIGA